ncbi:MAG: hypothetical protein AAF658_12505, partial [Myxococcota bacterium]
VGVPRRSGFGAWLGRRPASGLCLALTMSLGRVVVLVSVLMRVSVFVRVMPAVDTFLVDGASIGEVTVGAEALVNDHVDQRASEYARRRDDERRSRNPPHACALICFSTASHAVFLQ